MQFSQLLAATIPAVFVGADFITFLGTSGDMVPLGAASSSGLLFQFFNNPPSCDDALNAPYGVGGSIAAADSDPSKGVVCLTTDGVMCTDPSTDVIQSLEWIDTNDGQNIEQQVTEQSVGDLKIDSSDGGSTYNISTVADGVSHGSCVRITDGQEVSCTSTAYIEEGQILQCTSDLTIVSSN